MGGGIKCCRGCHERVVGCHSWCKRYLAEKKKHDEYVEAVRAGNDASYYVIGQYDKAREKAAKKKKKQGPYDYR